MSNQVIRTTPTVDNPDGISFIPESVALDLGKSRGGGGSGAAGTTVAGSVADFVTNHGTSSIPQISEGSGYSYTQTDVPGKPATFNDGTRNFTWNETDGVYYAGDYPTGPGWSCYPQFENDALQPPNVYHETANFLEVNEEMVVIATYYFTRDANGVWTQHELSDVVGAIGPAPVLPDGFSFFQNYNREHI